jgi:hypothetical protein
MHTKTKFERRFHKNLKGGGFTNIPAQSGILSLQLAAFSDPGLELGFPAAGADAVKKLHNVETFHDGSEDNVLVIQPGWWVSNRRRK